MIRRMNFLEMTFKQSDIIRMNDLFQKQVVGDELFRRIAAYSFA